MTKVEVEQLSQFHYEILTQMQFRISSHLLKHSLLFEQFLDSRFEVFFLHSRQDGGSHEAC